MPSTFHALVLATGLSCVAGIALAADTVKQQNSTAIWFDPWMGLSNATLVVSAPNGKISEIIAPTGTPVFELDRAEAPDGTYRFELSAATEERTKIVNPQDNGRGDAQSDTAAVPFYLSGSFVVERGVIITPKEVTESDG